MKQPQVVVVTGSRKGIGEYLCKEFAAKGDRVVGCSRQPATWKHKNYQHVLCDVTDEAGVKSLMSEVERRYKRLDILINNAGVASMNHSLLMPMAAVDRIMKTNFGGTFLFCREAAKLMQKRKYGRIVNMSSVAVPLHLEGEAVYASSKSAVITLTQILAREFAPFGITCNAVAPSPIETDLIRSVPRQKINAIIERMAIKRLGRFEDVGNAVEFFTRRESDYITGQVLFLGGVSGS